MYELPAHGEIKKCIITKNTILRTERPMVVYADGRKSVFETSKTAFAEKAPPKAESA